MTASEWITIGAAIFGGFFLGVIFSAVTRRLIGKDSNPDAIKAAAKPIASLVFSVFVIIGLVVALGVIRPSSVDALIDDSISFIPKVLTAAIILIAANVLSTFALTAVGSALSTMPVGVQRKASLLIKLIITVFATLLAASHLGIQTDIVAMALAAIFFTIGGSLVLLIGLGGHGVAKQVAASRALKRLLSVGDTVTVEAAQGVVQEMHPTAVEVLDAAGKTVFIPSAEILNGSFTVTRSS